MSLPDNFAASIATKQSTVIGGAGTSVTPGFVLETGSRRHGNLQALDSTLKSAVAVGIDDSPRAHDLDSTRTPYRTISTFRSALDLLCIIFGNCICSLLIALCLSGFSKQDDLVSWQKTAFNTLSILLSAALGFGIGFLCDRIGLLARGAVLQSRAHPVSHIGYIIRGSLFGYLSLFMRRPTNFVVLLYLICAICGRFGVAFLGFGYSVEQNPEYTPPLLRPDWVNMTISGSATERTRVGSTSGGQEMNSFDYDSLRSMNQFAQISRALPKANMSTIDPGRYIAESIPEAARMENFLMSNVDMEIIGTTVQFRYKFQDMNGTTPQDANWVALIKSSCWRYDVHTNPEVDSGYINSLTQVERDGKNFSAPYLWSNITGEHEGAYMEGGLWRWIMKTYRQLENVRYDAGYWSLDSVPRGGVHELWLIGQTMDDPTETPDMRKDRKVSAYDDFLPAKLFLFNCSFSLEDMPTALMLPTITDVPEDPATNRTQPRILGKDMYDFLRSSYVDTGNEAQGSEPFDPTAGITLFSIESHMDFTERPTYNWGIGRKNQTDSEIWLAAYVGRYLINQLSFLNDVLATVEIRPESSKSPTKLLVNWSRVVLILGGLLAFQILFAALALYYCCGRFELLDDVWTIVSVLEVFTDPSRSEPNIAKGTNFSGEFVQDENGFRWELTKPKPEC